MSRFAMMAALFVVASITVILVARAQDKHPTSRESDKGDPMRVRYSKSGYDITRLTKEEIDKILPTLTEEQVRVTMHADTEPPHCGAFTNTKDEGIYVCVVGGLPMFKSSAKFISKSGWASFFEPFDPDHIIEKVDESHGMVRVEILDARSGAHLGHVFDDGPEPTGKRYCLNSAALKFIKKGDPIPAESLPVKPENAYFAGGCFWGVEDRLAAIPGVMDAVSGYMGGRTEKPTYKQICDGMTDHAETVKVVYDPRRIKYEKLLDAFFTMHDPTTKNRQGPDVGTQYRSAIFASSADQAKAAREAIAKLQATDKFKDRPIVTQVIEPGPTFWAAEDYHQDYHLKHGGSCQK